MNQWLEHISRFGEQPAIVYRNQVISYRELTKPSGQSLERYSAVDASNQVATILCLIEAVHTGKTILPYTPHDLPNREKLLGKGSALLHKFLAQEQPGLVLATSGTSGKPRWVLHRLDIIAQKYAKLKTALKTVLVFPLHHISGIETVLSVLSAGGTIYLPSSNTHDQVLAAIAQYKPHFISCTPTYLRMLMLYDASGKQLQNLRFVNLGGEPTDAASLAFFRNALPNLEIKQAFGTTETSNLRTFQVDGQKVHLGQNGQDFTVKNGVLHLPKGRSLVGFLWPDGSASNWLSTGDKVALQDDGSLLFLGRESQVINVGGEKVFPAKVEEVLLQHEAVIHAKVFAQEHAFLGQVVAAKVVLAQPVSNTLLRKHCAAHLPAHAVPMQMHKVDEIDMSSQLKSR